MSTGWIRVRKKPRPAAVVRARAPEPPARPVIEEAVRDEEDDELEPAGAAKQPRVAEVEEVESSPQRGAALESQGSQRRDVETQRVLAAWSRSRETRSPALGDSGSEVHEDEVVADDHEPPQAPRQRLWAAGAEEVVEEDDDERGTRRGGLSALRRLQDEDDIASSSQSSPVRETVPPPPVVPARAAEKTPALRFVVGTQSGAHCVQRLNRVASARRAAPTHRLWLTRWAPAGAAREGWAGRGWLLNAPEKSADQSATLQPMKEVAVFSRHGRHAGLSPGAWLRHAAIGECSCAVSGTALALCGVCTLQEDWALDASEPDASAAVVIAIAPLPPVDRVRVTSMVASAAVERSSSSYCVSRSLQLRNAQMEGASSGLLRFWRCEDTLGRALLLQGPPELPLPSGPCIVRPAPGLIPVRAELLGGAEGALVWVGLFSAAFRVDAEV